MKLFRTYNKAKDLFVRPKINWKIGLWKNDPCLPVWRKGKVIKLYKHHIDNNLLRYTSRFKKEFEAYNVRNEVIIYKGKSPGGMFNPNGYDRYGGAGKHRLPGKLKNGDIVWRRDIRKRLKRWGLGWIKPQYQLPLFFAFHIFDHDVIWKSKWGSTRYEYPPQFTIVLFGISFSVWLTAPKVENCWDDNYWEALIDWGFYKEKYNGDVVKFLKEQGYIEHIEYTDEELQERDRLREQYTGSELLNRLADYPGRLVKTPAISKKWIRPEFHQQYDEYVENIFNKI